MTGYRPVSGDRELLRIPRCICDLVPSLLRDKADMVRSDHADSSARTRRYTDALV